MARILVRNLDDACVERLNNRAAQNGRSLQAEAKLVLEQSVRNEMKAAREMAARMRKKLGRRSNLDSVEILRGLRDA